MDNLTEYRLANAKEKLESAKLLLDAGKYKDSIGRSALPATNLRMQMPSAAERSHMHRKESDTKRS